MILLRRYDYKLLQKPLYTGVQRVVRTVTARVRVYGLGVSIGQETAGPSTALRSGRDDKFCSARKSFSEKYLPPPQNVIPRVCNFISFLKKIRNENNRLKRVQNPKKAIRVTGSDRSEA